MEALFHKKPSPVGKFESPPPPSQAGYRIYFMQEPRIADMQLLSRSRTF